MISATGIHVSLGEGAARRGVLHGVDLEIERGEIVGLIGPPEAGKTVLLKTLAGLVAPAAGRITWDGERVDDTTHRRRADWQQRIGMAFQNDALFDAMSVFDNVAFPLRRRRLAEEEVTQRVMARLDEVELADARDKYPAEISGGMRKRAGIARATVIMPQLGLFDDPIAGLDPVTGANILSFIVRLTDSLNMASLVISNDLAVLLPICRRVIMMVAGEVVYLGDADGLVASPRPEVVQFATGGAEGPL